MGLKRFVGVQFAVIIEIFRFRYVNSRGACTLAMAELWAMLKRLKLAFVRRYHTID